MSLNWQLGIKFHQYTLVYLNLFLSIQITNILFVDFWNVWNYHQFKVYFQSTSEMSYVNVRTKPYLDVCNKKCTDINLIRHFDICEGDNCSSRSISWISWNDTNIYCQNKNMNLPSINSYDEMLDLFNYKFSR